MNIYQNQKRRQVWKSKIYWVGLEVWRFLQSSATLSSVTDSRHCVDSFLAPTGAQGMLISVCLSNTKCQKAVYLYLSIVKIFRSIPKDSSFHNIIIVNCGDYMAQIWPQSISSNSQHVIRRLIFILVFL